MSGSGPLGGYLHPDGEIEINAGRPTTTLAVVNVGDRPIQVGSHAHLAEVNRALRLDRMAAYGQRLDIPAGTSVRFEPGMRRLITAVSFGGDRVMTGGMGLVGGALDDPAVRERFRVRLVAAGVITADGDGTEPLP